MFSILRIIVVSTLLLHLSGCATLPSTQPLTDFSQSGKTLAIINAFPEEISYSTFTSPIWRNSQKYISDPKFSLEKYVDTAANYWFTQFGAKSPAILQVSRDQKLKWTIQGKENLNGFLKRIGQDKELFAIAESNGTQELVLIIPAVDRPPNGRYGAPSAGLRYYDNGIIEPYAAMRVFVIDIPSRKILGSHYLTSPATEVVIENTLDDNEITLFTKTFKTEQAEKTGSAIANPDVLLARNLRIACADYSQIDDYSEANKLIVRNGVSRAVDRVFSKLAKIYLGRPLPPMEYWQSGFKLTTPYSCKEVL